MIVIKPGYLRCERFRGTCTSCGCEVECIQGEVDLHSQVSCPTDGCGSEIYIDCGKPAPNFVSSRRPVDL